MNVPDDWHCQWVSCAVCGGWYHASEPQCDCVEARRGIIEDAIADEIGPEGPLPVEVTSLGNVRFRSWAAMRCGLLSDEAPSTEHRAELRRVMGALRRAANVHQLDHDVEAVVDGEVETIDSYDGERWLIGPRLEAGNGR